jgi:talin
MILAKAVANAAAMMVLKAKNVAQVADDTVLQNRVIAAATQCALSTSQLVACAKVQHCRPFTHSHRLFIMMRMT